jgi:iron complex outermembrane receptor protein
MSANRDKLIRGIMGATSLLALSMPATVFAQEAPGEAEVVADDIVVTGSRIRGVVPVGGNLITMDRSKIELSSAATATELLREVPQVVNLGADDSHKGSQGAQANTAFASGVNLRGIGGSSTLLMLNGRRIVPSGGQGQYTDPSFIPSIAVERMEVMADGASAIYGSDAIAGVVNLITRSKFEGAETRARYGLADGTDRLQLGQIFGSSWNGGHGIVAFEYMARSELKATDRDFYREDLTPFGGTDYRGNLCNPGTLVVNRQTYALPAGDGTNIAPGSLVAGTANRCNLLEQGWLLPEQRRFSIFSSFEQELVPGLKFLGQVSYSKRNFHQIVGSRTAAITVRNTNPYFVTPVPGATSVTVNYVLPGEFGFEENKGSAKVFQAVAGLEANLWGDWRINASGTYGKSNDSIIGLGRVNAANLTIAGASADPTIAINPFGSGNNNPASVYNFIRNHNLSTPSSTMRMLEAQADGSLIDLPGGTVRLALGAEARWDKLTTRSQTFNPNGSVTEDPRGLMERTVTSLYGELLVPVFGTANAMPGFNRLELSVAFRRDHYNDFGSTQNPKFGVTWEPVRGFSLRGSYGESFRAPNMSELATTTIKVQQRSRIDPLSSTGTSLGVLLSGGNPNLAPETSKTWTVGFDLNPIAAPGLSLSVTYFDIDYRGQVLDIYAEEILPQEAAYAAFITRNPSEALINSYLALYPATSAINPLNNAFFIDGRRQNLGITDVAGFDFSARYGWGAFDGQMYLAASGSYFTRYKTLNAPGVPAADRLNTINYPVDLTFRADLGWSNDAWRTRASVNYLAGYLNNASTPTQNVASYVTADAYVGYTLGKGGSGVLSDVTIGLDVQNLFDRKPNFVNIPGGYDGEKASAMGRLVSLSLTKRW